jgi:hypothetical protein
MNGQSMLERRYRRLLRWYPAAHRAQHGEEMIGVLLDAARPGQRWPGVIESANLVRSGVQIWLRRVPSGDPGSAWSGTLGALSILVPFIWMVDQAMRIAEGDTLWWKAPAAGRLPLPLTMTWVHAPSGLLGWLQLGAANLDSLLSIAILAIFVLLRLRRTAIAWLVLVMVPPWPRIVGFYPYGFMLGRPGGLGLITLQLVALAALLAASQPLPRPMAIGGRVWLLAGVIAGTMGATSLPPVRSRGGPWLPFYEPWHNWRFPVILAGLAAMIALTAMVPGCRRVMLLLAVPVMYYVGVPLYVVLGVGEPMDLILLPLVVLLCLLAVVMIRRFRFPPESAAGGSRQGPFISA